MKANLAALETLRVVQMQDRPATGAEQAVLARWGGWGAQGVWQVWDEDRPEHAADRARLRELLSPTEVAAARLTMINAHYTDAAVVAAVWEMVEALGFAGGRVLEPGCGSGTFIGLAPTSAVLTGVELDPTTAGIARLLYPSATIRQESFADTRFPEGHFDAAVGNVPFSDVILHDPRHNSGRLSMHNHFIVKSLHLVRPGGVVAVLTSRFTMDATNPAARRAIGELADLVTAVRLPSGTHRRSAGTEAVTDLLVLRRREPGREPADTIWQNTTQLSLPAPSGDGEEKVRTNIFWLHHPDQVLGTAALEVGMHGVVGLEIRPHGPIDAVAEQLRTVLAAAVTTAKDQGLGVTPRTESQQEWVAAWTPAHEGAADGELVGLGSGRFAVIEEGGRVPVNVPKTQAAEVTALLELRDQARALIAAEATRGDTADVEPAREQLASSWRRYVDRYGPINRSATRATGRVDPGSGEPILARVMPPAVRLVTKSTFGTVVAALEVFDDVTQTAEPASLLRHRLLLPRQPAQHAETAADGLAVVLDRVGRVDLDEIGRLTGSDRASVLAELGDHVFQVPGSDEWQTRAHYLSGNVREKLDAARAAERAEPGRWTSHVTALEAVLPEDIGAGDITARLGAVWIPDTDHEQFLRDLLGARDWVTVTRLAGSAWEVKGPSWGVPAIQEWGTDRMPAPRLMAAVMGQRMIAVYDRDGEKEVLNPTETVAAQEKARLLQERFGDWIWEDPERATRLLAEYNRRFNSTRLRDYTDEGQRLTLPGLADGFTPRVHQRTAVARMINEPSVGLFHDVGAGKTAEMVIGVTELRRLGLIRKPAVVVPNHMLEQFSREWQQLYPQAKILAASSDELAADRRRRFVARVATSDWDGVILTRTAFERLSLTPANEAAYQDRQLTHIREGLQRVRAVRGDTVGVKRLERAMLKAEERLKALRDVKADPDLHFEMTGIDYLVVDELHHYKNLATTSAIPDANITGSKRAADLDAKVDYLRHTTGGGRVITGATATPIANSITEMYVVQRYLHPDGLAAAGITDFDAWAATFGEVVTAPELAVAGGGRFKIKSRFARFTNIPELLGMFHTFADVKTAADLDLPRPNLATRPDGQRAPRIVLVPPTSALDAYIADLGRRTDEVSHGAVDPSEDNMLKISGDGRKAALAMRLADPTSAETGKIKAAADELARVWEQTRHNRYLDSDTGELSPIPGSLQIVFCDLATPSERWNAYDALRDALIARGLPRDGVRFIHEARNDAEKATLFAACRTGRVAVIIGSTEKMGVGTNIQQRAIHLMDLDAPWRPADVAQRHGRILRQGNQNQEVAITQVVTERSFDAYMWQTLQRKAAFIDQIMTGNGVNRTSGDIGDATLNAAEVKALASGNPLLLDLAAAEQDLARFTRLERAHATTERTLANTIEHARQSLADTRRRIVGLEQLDAVTVPTVGDRFRFNLPDGRAVTQRADAAAALNRTVARIGREPTTIGQLGGHTILATATIGHDKQGRSVRTITWRFGGDDGLDLTTTSRPDEPYRVDVGTISRLEHLTASIPSHVDQCRRRIDDLEHTLSQAERVQGKPFQHAADLAATRARYTDLTAQVADIQNQPAGNEPAWETVAAAGSPGKDAQHAQPVPTVAASAHGWNR